MKILPKLSPKKDEQRRAEMYQALIRREAKKGGQLFGQVPAGHHREFFCLDEHTWVWHEEWTDQNGKRQAVTTRYDVRPNGVLKSYGGQSYQVVSDDELWNLYDAAKMFYAQLAA